MVGANAAHYSSSGPASSLGPFLGSKFLRFFGRPLSGWTPSHWPRRWASQPVSRGLIGAVNPIAREVVAFRPSPGFHRLIQLTILRLRYRAPAQNGASDFRSREIAIGRRPTQHLRPHRSRGNCDDEHRSGSSSCSSWKPVFTVTAVLTSVFGLECTASISSSPSSRTVIESVLARLDEIELRRPSVDQVEGLFPGAGRHRLERPARFIRWLGEGEGAELTLLPAHAGGGGETVASVQVWRTSSTRQDAPGTGHEWAKTLGETLPKIESAETDVQLDLRPRSPTGALSVKIFKSSKGWDCALSIEWVEHASAQ